MGKAENVIVRDVLHAIDMAFGHRAILVRVQAGSFSVGNRFIRGAEAGTADLLGVIAGVPVALEVKTKSGRQSESQKQWQERWTNAGGVYAVVRSGMEAIEAVRRAPHQA